MFRFLIVDDNENDALLISSMIEQDHIEHVRCEHCGSCWSALGWLNDKRHGTTDAILLDLNLPDSIGLETYRAVRKAAPDAAIVIWSGREDDRALRDQLIEEGASGYLDKGNVKSRQIYETLRDSVKLRKSFFRYTGSRDSEKKAQEYVDEVRSSRVTSPKDQAQAEALAASIRQSALTHQLFVQQGDILSNLLAEVKSLQHKSEQQQGKLDEVEETGRHTIVELEKTTEISLQNKKRLAMIGAVVAVGSYSLGESRETIMKLVASFFGVDLG